jgi:hypothetical protein
MVRFTTGQLGNLPEGDVDCTLELPDGVVVNGRFHKHHDNPYIGGPSVVKWIKSWVRYNVPVQAVVDQVGLGTRLRLRVGAAGPSEDVSLRRRVLSSARQLGRVAQPVRRRKMYEAWERDPSLRRFALQAWSAACQVEGCTLLGTVPPHLQPKMVDVHHLNHVAKGGDDSPLNICILCVVHHQLMHRTETAILQSWDLDGAVVLVNGLTLAIRRDGRALL